MKALHFTRRPLLSSNRFWDIELAEGIARFDDRGAKRRHCQQEAKSLKSELWDMMLLQSPSEECKQGSGAFFFTLLSVHGEGSGSAPPHASVSHPIASS
jgi:hypothetical protein